MPRPSTNSAMPGFTARASIRTRPRPSNGGRWRPKTATSTPSTTWGEPISTGSISTRMLDSPCSGLRVRRTAAVGWRTIFSIASACPRHEAATTRADGPATAALATGRSGCIRPSIASPPCWRNSSPVRCCASSSSAAAGFGCRCRVGCPSGFRATALRRWTMGIVWPAWASRRARTRKTTRTSRRSACSSMATGSSRSSERTTGCAYRRRNRSPAGWRPSTSSKSTVPRWNSPVSGKSPPKRRPRRPSRWTAADRPSCCRPRRCDPPRRCRRMPQVRSMPVSRVPTRRLPRKPTPGQSSRRPVPTLPRSPIRRQRQRQGLLRPARTPAPRRRCPRTSQRPMVAQRGPMPEPTAHPPPGRRSAPETTCGSVRAVSRSTHATGSIPRGST